MREEFTNFYFKTIFNFIKENKTLVLLLPTLIGSFYQILSLSLIDTNIIYLKFFSISQSISDSLIFILIISLSLLINYTVLFVFFEKIKTKRKKHLNRDKVFELEDKDIFIIFIFNGSIITLAFIYFLISKITFSDFHNLFESFNLNRMSILIFNNFLGIFTLLYIAYSYRKTTLIFHEKGNFNNIYILLILILISFSIELINHSFNFTKNINSETKIKEIQSNLNTKSEIKIRYLNDKYIFYKIEDTGKIYIEKTENVF